MEGVSFAGAEHSTPVPIRPPVQLSIPKMKRQTTTPKVPPAAKRASTGKKGTPVKATPTRAAPAKATPAKKSAKVSSEKATPGKSTPGTWTNRGNSAGLAAGRPVKSLPARANFPAIGLVYFEDVEKNVLRKLPAGKLPEELESMKLLLNEALDLRYSQEIQLEHERSPGFFVPVVDSIDYRGLLERLSLATSHQSVRVVVYNKIEGLPATPIRSLYTPNGSVSALPIDKTPTKSSSSAIVPDAPQLNSIEPSTFVPIVATSNLPSSSDKAKVHSTPKSARSELPASTAEPRKPTLPKSSLSISVSAADISIAPDEEEVIAPSQEPIAPTKAAETAIAEEKSRRNLAKKDKKRKRDDDEGGDSSVTAQEGPVDTAKAKKKQKRNVDQSADITVGGEDTTVAQPKALTKSQKRRLVREEKRKAAISEQRDKDALKLAIVLGEQTGSDGADVSQSEQDTGRVLSRKEKRARARQSEARLAVERSLTEASEAMPSEDVNMEDSTVAEENVTAVPPMGASAKTVSVSEKIRDAPMTFTEEDPAVSVEVSTTAVASLNDAAHSTTSPAQTEAMALSPMAEATSATVSAHKPKEKSKRKKERQQVVEAKEAGKDVSTTGAQTLAHPLASGTDANQSVRKQAETAPIPDNTAEKSASAVDTSNDETKSTQETKSQNRAARRKSMKANQVATESVAVSSAGEVAAQASSTNTATVPITAETSPAVTAEKSKQAKGKAKKSQTRKSSALNALAEWRAQQSKGAAAGSDAFPATSSSAIPGTAISQSADGLKEKSPTAQSEGKAPEEGPMEKSSEEESAVKTVPTMKQSTATAEKLDADESDEPVAAESDTDKTPPASSAQIPLPPPSQQIARLPSSSPESYPSDSEESEDAWQKAHKRMRSPDSEDIEPEGDDEDDDEEEEGRDIGRKAADETDSVDGTALDRASSEAIAPFTQPVSIQVPMEVESAAEDDQIESESFSPPAPSSPISGSPTSTSPVVYTIPVPSTQQNVDTAVEAIEPADASQEATPRAETPRLYTITQDPIVTPTLSHTVPTALSLSDLAAPTSPQMPSTGIVAFHDAMEEDAAADQAAMEKLDTDSVNGEISSADADQPNEASQSVPDSATSRPVSSQSQNTFGSPRRLRSRMKLRDGSQPEFDPVKPLPLPTATPKRKGRQPKAISQVATPVQKTASTPIAVPVPETVVNGTNGVSAEADSPAPTMTRKERRIAASQSRIPALSSLSADALRKGRGSRFNSANGNLPTNGTMSQPTRMLTPTQSAATSDTDEEDDDADTDSGSDSGDDSKNAASSLPVGLASRVAGSAAPKKSRPSLGAMKGW